MVININGLNRLNDSVNRDVKDFESYIYDLLSTVKNMSYYWHDGYTTSFFKQIDRQHADINDLVNTIYRLSNALQIISSYYNGINYSKGDIGAWGWVSTEDFYACDGDDEERISRKQNLLYRNWHAEDDIAYNISIVNPSYVIDTNFDNLDINNEKTDFIGMQDNMNDEINKLRLKLDCFNMNSDRLINELYSLGSVYNSSNVSKFNSKVDAVTDSINRLHNNFINAHSYICESKKKYKAAFENLASEIKNGG